MTRRTLDFVIILLFVWGGMLLGLWIISSMIVPMSIPGVSRYLVNILQVIVSASMALLWLLLWRWLARSMFWRALRNNQNK
jgi:hypothetical protein